VRLNDTVYTFLFAGVVCLICSLLVSTSAVSLRARQEANKLLDRQQKVLAVSGLVGDDESLSADLVRERFSTNIEARIVNLETGEYVAEGEVDPATFDQVKTAKNPGTSRTAPPNRAGIRRIPNYALVYQVMDGGNVTELILPVEGKGLWSTLYGYLALDKDTTTIKGLTFYQHGETPGLGGEVDNPRWKSLWPERKAYDENWEPEIRVIKGPAGSPEEAPHSVDGLSGATITSNGVTHLLQFWLGENGFGPYLEKFREKGS
jgi:Na+-transporting NADH:ubiquinone oxidoreductase subunit C